MTDDVREALRSLLTTSRVLSVGLLVDGDPDVGLLPYALGDTPGTLYVQASGLARHSRGLHSGAQVGVLIHAPDTPDADAMQLTRLSVQASVRVLERDTSEFASAAAHLVARFPAAAVTLQLGDFNVYALTLGRGRFVQGFARAFNVGSDTFGEL